MSREVKYAPVKTFNPGVVEFLAGLFVGTFLIAPFIWTELGRRMAVEAIRRGAGVARERVEEWLRRGEKRE
ncbi:MAG: hypothetical protein DRG31_07715 [Deltaproteobacteria bacterium]|nr:MAG: hypothetical protein DRG31_07715 [Deltaproteobacteria bacterium]